MTRRCAIYGRISLDKEGEGAGVERQREDGHSLADRLGHEVVAEYLDNSVSAFNKKKKRPEFERMLRDMELGRFDTIIVWRSDRLARQPRDLERVIDVLERSGGQLLSVTEPEFSGPTGLLVLRMLGAFANHESQVKRERVARRWKADAERGRFRSGGNRTTGYNVDGTVRPDEAAFYREAVTRVLAGERPNAVMADLNHRGFRTTSGRVWNLSNFKRMLSCPRQAGIVIYQGEPVDVPGDWVALIPRDRWDALQGRLKAVQGGAQRKRVQRHHLTGLAVCGVCGTTLGGVLKRRDGKEFIQYQCDTARGGCNGVGIRGRMLEPVVLERFLAVVATPRFASLVDRAKSHDSQVVQVIEQLRSHEVALEQLVKDHYVEQLVDRETFLRAKTQLDKKIRDGQRRMDTEASAILTMPHDAETLRAEWERRPAEWRRAVLETLIDRIIVRPGKGPDRVTVIWKS